MKIAIVGCGQIADAHIREARKIPGVEVAAVCDLSRHMAEQAAVRFAVPGIYTDVRALLNEVRPHVVHITTPPSSHLALGKLAVEHGAHVYMEKPFAVTLGEAEELVAAANRTGRLICVGHSHAFESNVLRLRELVAAGGLGEIVHIDSSMGYGLAGGFGSVFMRDPTHWIHRLPGGVAQNNISHPLSLILPFLDDEKPAIQAIGRRVRSERYGDVRDEFFDEVRATIVGRRVSATMMFSCRIRPVQVAAVVFGSLGVAELSSGARTLRLSMGSTLPGPFQKVDWARRDALDARREYRRQRANLVRARLHYFEGMNSLLRQFFLATQGKGELPIPMSDAVRVTAIIDEITQRCRESA
jgi:predicted dehydrogenase